MKRKITTLSIALLMASSASVQAQITNAAPYCQPAIAAGSSIAGAISNVTLGTLNNSTFLGSSAASYTNAGNVYQYYNNVAAPTLTPGSGYTISLEFKSTYDGEPRWYAAYIDFNGNNTFDTTTEMIIDMAHANVIGLLPWGSSFTTFLTTVRTNTFTVPATALAGTRRMRVIREGRWSNVNDSVSRLQPCGFASAPYGEIEDYNITIGSATAPAPTVTTLAATAISATGATLNGSVNANGVSSVDTFEYGLTTAYGNKKAGTPATVTGTTATSVTTTIGGLTAGTVYHYRVRAANANGSANGADMTFTTATNTAAPAAVTGAATAVLSTKATLNGTINANNANATVTFKWGLTTAYGSVANATPATVTGNTATNVAATLTGLMPNTTYHYQVSGVSSAGTGNGVDMTFKTTSGVGVAEVAGNKDFRIYPNPSTGYFIVEPANAKSSAAYTVHVYAANGALVRSLQLKGQEKAVIEKLGAGQYLVEIASEDGSRLVQQVLLQ